MTRPAVSDTTERAYEALVPWTIPDEAGDWPLLRFTSGLTSARAKIDELVRDGDHPGWSSIVDIDRTSADGLPWLGQLLGATVDAALSEGDQRQQLREVSSWRRGTRAAIIGAAQPYLTGTKTVMVDERDTSAYHFRVRTFAAETPDPDLVLLALKAQKPAGLVMEYDVVEGITYDEIKASLKSYDDLSTEFPTSDDMKTAQSV